MPHSRTIITKGVVGTWALLLLLAIPAQGAIGDWKVYPALHNATKSVVASNKVYVLSDGGLYSYSPDDGEVQTYEKNNPLSDNSIAYIDYCAAQKALLIVYSNANIDLLYNDGTVYNVTDFKNKTTLADKTINFVKVEGTSAYMATNFGVVVFNIAKREFTNTYTLDLTVRCCTQYENYIIANTSSGIYAGNLSDNLLDAANWKKISPYVFHDLATFDSKLIVLGKYDGVYSLNPDTKKLTTLLKGKYNYIYTVDSKMVAANSAEMVIFDNATTYSKYTLNGLCNYIAVGGNNYWSCEGTGGLVGYKIENSSLVQKVASVIPNSPRRNYCDYITFTGDRMLVAGGTLNYFDQTFYDGTLMVYENGKWSEFEEDSIAIETGEDYKNITGVAQDPLDSRHHFACSFGHGLYEFKDYKFVKHYTYNNSILETVNPDYKPEKYVRVSRVVYDNDGNLWMTNSGSNNIIKILKKDGTWTSLYYGAIAKYPTMVDLLFDSRGWVWMTSMQSSPAIFCANLNGTLEDVSDDKTKVISGNFTNQDGEVITVNTLFCLTQDRDGTLWCGTDQGLFTLFNPQNFFNSSYTFTQIKVPRNDGTNYADYLLDGIYVTAVCVDGDNRKWVGTQTNGVYLISADGLQTLHHFTVDNSPLISNSIKNISIHPNTGEVFIGTESGLVSYMGDATEPQSELKESNVHAFPNPVKADYTGLITIIGLSSDTNVKIVTSDGKAVYEGTSLGGSFSWNGKNSMGRRVATGVYYVLASDSEGNEGIATKILFIK